MAACLWGHYKVGKHFDSIIPVLSLVVDREPVFYNWRNVSGKNAGFSSIQSESPKATNRNCLLHGHSKFDPLHIATMEILFLSPSQKCPAWQALLLL